jgi:uncharacterized membrane protein YeaQ/YmgE (transglycosylase-associated protein family)
MFMNFLWMIVVGLVVGAIAKMLMPGRDPGGTIVTILIGIAGSVIAGFLGRSVGWYTAGQPAGFIASIAGAIILLLAYRVITGSGTRGSGTGSGRIDRAA